jgi:hypothetical protein
MAESWKDFADITDEEFAAMPLGRQIELGQRIARTVGIELTPGQAGFLAARHAKIMARERERHGHRRELADREPGS